ncbi:diaminopimelate decarboxylase [Ligilactobacillus apodemi]|uniref:diaminopimelate decarboxylase n=1 Tax=Ligilactobacillus apodemi TaxID=307126 RepID=UPI00214CADDF|nr:diaminopimelate decarboxylase [Ligilactobacillus apodemi]MCR1900687.1 diaminopimelate decarboxylase [Ligilactobacillus apodemi]
MEVTTNDNRHLTIGGIDAVNLAHKYQTPLVVYDVAQIKAQINAFKRVFEEQQVAYEVSYASKAFCATAIYQVINTLGCHTDVVSGGELATALKAGFPAEKISFHGNNKSIAELEYAVKSDVGVIIVDNFYEIELLIKVLREQNKNTRVILRVTPGISAHTHEYDQTGQVDSKFGFDIDSGQADKALEQLLNEPNIEVLGLHAHIGSQIFELGGFELVGQKLMQIAKHWQDKFGYETKVLNVGGGFGIKYTAEDTPLAPEKFVEKIIQVVKKQAKELEISLPAIWIEPGRSIVGPAGYNLYTIGARKDIPGHLPYLAVDGGMGDNIRPALYQAKYAAVLANDPKAKIQETVHLAGKYCESGDILIDELALPKTKPGDIIAMLATGAYGYSMASNYNRNPRPAVVFVENGQAKLVVKRETYADLTHLDQPYL